jgi:tetratricopeptide (TPR) repeat protein
MLAKCPLFGFYCILIALSFTNPTEAFGANPSAMDPATVPQIANALQQFREGNVGQAIFLLKQAEVHPAYEDANYKASLHVVLGTIYERSGDYVKASSEFRIVTTSYPTVPAAQTVKRELLDMDVDKANSGGPHSIYKRITTEQDRATAAALAARFISENYGARHVAGAQAAYDAYVNKYGYDAGAERAQMALAVAYEVSGNYNKSYSIVSDMMTRYPDAQTNPTYVIQQGYYANLVGRGDEASDLFARAMTMSMPDSLRAKAILGQAVCYRDKGQIDLEKGALDRATVLAQKSGYQVSVK